MLALSKLAKDFCTKTDDFKNRNEIRNELTKLTHRTQQLNQLSKEAKGLEEISSLLKGKEISHTFPQRKLSARIKNLNVLTQKYSKDQKVILEDQILDVEKYEASFSEIEDKLKDVWGKFTAYDKRADQYANMEYDDESIDQTIEALKQLIIDLKIQSINLPLDKDTIDSSKKKKDEIVNQCDLLESQGLDQEVSKFLTDTRKIGFSLEKLLENPKILSWVKNQASSFIVKRKI